MEAPISQPINGRVLLIGAGIVLLTGFLAGFIPQFRTASGLRDELRNRDERIRTLEREAAFSRARDSANLMYLEPAFYAQAPPASEPTKTVDEIVQDVMRAADRQRTTLKPYSVTRRYTVRNRHLKRDAVLDVLWTYDPAKGKQFRIVSNQGATGLTRRSLLKVLEAEAKNSKTKTDPSRISPEHYRFELAGIEPNNYRLRLQPREKSKYLVNGQAQVLRRADAIVRVEGRTAKRLSFWVSEADIVQEFINAGGFWLPYRTQSAANIRFVGRTELVIDAGQYHFVQ